MPLHTPGPCSQPPSRRSYMPWNSRNAAPSWTVRSSAVAVLLGIPLWWASAPARAETRGYIVSWFATATHAQDFKLNCPLDKNGGGLNLAIRNLMDIGYPREDA